MECKGWQWSICLWTESSINRNIMECKVNRVTTPVEYAFGINRNIMECKGGTASILFKFFHVLIET